jgi:tetratricopeptide (TPR) repeat protein
MDKTAEPENKSRVREFALAAALMLALVFAVYWPALRGGFVWDDQLTVEKNPLVSGEFTLRSMWFQMDFPLTTIVLWIEWLLWGKNPVGYHIVNALLHATNVFLLWQVLSRLKVPGAGLAAFLFAVHPVAVASVAWISELKNTLSLFFMLLSFLLYLRFDTDVPENERPRYHWYWLSLVVFVLALLSKTSVVVLPVTMLGCVWWQRTKISSHDFLRTIPFFVLSLAFGLMTAWFQKTQVIRGDQIQTEGLLGRLANGGIAIWFYLGKALLPTNLSMIYPRWEINPGQVLNYVPLVLFAAILIALALCWRLGKRWARHVLFALAFFAVSLFPVLGFFDMYYLTISRVSDHFAYLALIPIIALVAGGVSAIPMAKVAQAAAAVLVIALAVLTFQRAKVFVSNEALWRDTLAKNPNSWNAHNNLACILAEQRQFDEAMREFEASLKINPRNAKAHCNLGRAAMMNKNVLEAERHFVTALEIRPDDPDAHRFYAQLLAGTGRVPQAVEHMREAVRAQPDVPMRLQLAQLLMGTGAKAEAAAEYRQVLESKPDNVEALNNLAGILATSGDERLRNGQQAVELAERAVRLKKSDQAQVLGTLAAAYAEAGRFKEAVDTAQKAVAAANAAGDSRTAAIHGKMIQFYSTGRPYHEPSKTSAGP